MRYQFLHVASAYIQESESPLQTLSLSTSNHGVKYDNYAASGCGHIELIDCPNGTAVKAVSLNPVTIDSSSGAKLQSIACAPTAEFCSFTPSQVTSPKTQSSPSQLYRHYKLLILLQ
ncbi:MAG TPA: hypothetical protein VJ729_07650 [Nitrososphaeraceae archaeon]|nr:hypothetical protein [Nitrososphaeraceae archaeon]